jgi:transposase-like protein
MKQSQPRNSRVGMRGGSFRKPVPEKSELVSMLKAHSMKKVCQYYGVTAPTVYKWMRELSIPLQGKKVDR